MECYCFIPTDPGHTGVTSAPVTMSTQRPTSTPGGKLVSLFVCYRSKFLIFDCIAVTEWLAMEPTVKQLSHIKYTDSQGGEISFRLILEIQNKCEKLGIELEIDSPTLSGLKSVHSTDPPEFCTAVLSTWMERGGDVTWNRLLQALQDIQLGGIEKRLRKALNGLFQE